MKKYKNIIIAVTMTIVIVACDTTGGLDDFPLGPPAALASWIASPKGDLKLSNPSSSLDFEVELIDEDGGSTVESVTISVSKIISETEKIISGTLITQTSFAENENGNQGFSSSISLSNIATALGVAVDSFEEEDEFTFSTTVTRDGTEYLQAGGASTFLDGVADYSKNISVETVIITSVEEVDGLTGINESDTATVVLGFANDFGTELMVNPTVIDVDSQGNTGTGTIGAITPVLNEDGEDSVYTFLYTPSSINADTISFIVSDASALATGFVMLNDTLENIFIVDNVPPVEINGATTPISNDMGDLIGYSFEYTYNENVFAELREFIPSDPDDSDSMDKTTILVLPTDGNRFSFEWIFGVDFETRSEYTVKLYDISRNDGYMETFTFPNP